VAPGWLTGTPVAHRGFHARAEGRIENSASAVAAAIGKGFAIEVDLRITGDGKVVVFHDATLDRLCGMSGRVADLSFDVVTAQKLTGSEDTVLSFDALLRMVSGKVPLVIEIKTDRKSDGRLERAVAAALGGYQGPAAVMSFDPDCVGRMRQFAPDRPRGLIADRTLPKEGDGLDATRRFMLRHLLLVPKVRADFIAYDVKALPAPGPWVCRRLLRMPVLTWTVRSEDDRRTARAHADQMIFEGFDPGGP
jgi:glycerophosphoryl diester phosphodiesterase